MSEMDTTTIGITSSLDKCDNQRNSIHGADQGWSDSECCHLAYELHHLHERGDPWRSLLSLRRKCYSEERNTDFSDADDDEDDSTW